MHAACVVESVFLCVHVGFYKKFLTLSIFRLKLRASSSTQFSIF